MDDSDKKKAVPCWFRIGTGAMREHSGIFIRPPAVLQTNGWNVDQDMEDFHRVRISKDILSGENLDTFPTCVRWGCEEGVAVREMNFGEV